MALADDAADGVDDGVAAMEIAIEVKPFGVGAGVVSEAPMIDAGEN